MRSYYKPVSQIKDIVDSKISNDVSHCFNDITEMPL